MGTLPHQEIRKLIQSKGLVEGADLDRCLGPASYEIRIGTAMSLADKQEYEIADGVEFAMKPQSHLLIGSVETVKMPEDLCADLSLKSKFGRGGFLPWSQGFVDPGYQGKLTISLINMSPHPVILTGGQPICHMIFRLLRSATQKPYSGEYNGSQGATGPKEKPMLVLGSPLRDLVNAGVGGLVSGVAQGIVS
jgi:dCTP deaminase